MTTETLMLRRALHRAQPEDYVQWAVDRLCDGADAPNLRILAGLSTRFDRDEIEKYFLLTCQEFSLDPTPRERPPLETAGLIEKAYERLEATALEAVEMMADLNDSSHYAEPLLAPWTSMRDELQWQEGYYPSDALTSLDDAVRREWSLLARARKLHMLEGWLRVMRCSDCGHVGELAPKQKTLAARILGAFWRRYAGTLVGCANCGSSRWCSLQDPDARSAYLGELEQKTGAG